jgi:DNA-binding transcriptional ArsR family regulator
MNMTIPDIAQLAAVIGEPARSRMLSALLGGSLTATELAIRAEIASSTASAHLKKLLAAGLIACEVDGKWRRYRLASDDVAQLLETMALMAPTMEADGESGLVMTDMRHARSCYDHLAGKVGVAVTGAMLRQGILQESDASEEFMIGPAGDAWFGAMGIDLVAARARKRSFARRCLDWSERKPHLAGSLGAAVLARFLELGWIERVPGERAVVVTDAGVQGLANHLGDRELVDVLKRQALLAG